MSILCSALRSNTVLTELELQCLRLFKKDTEQQMVKWYDSCSGCEIGRDGAKELCIAFKKSKAALEHLYLYGLR